MAIKYSRSVLPISDLKTRAKDIVSQLKESGEPILITQRGRGAAVMESLDSYERRVEYYEAIDGVLLALREAAAGDLHEHAKALKILEAFGK